MINKKRQCSGSDTETEKKHKTFKMVHKDMFSSVLFVFVGILSAVIAAPVSQTKGMLLVFSDSVLRTFQDYFSLYETGQSVGGAKTGEPRTKKRLEHPQAELG